MPYSNTHISRALYNTTTTNTMGRSCSRLAFKSNNPAHTLSWLIFRLVATSDLFETLPEYRSLKSNIMTYNCNFKENGYLEYFI